MPSARSSSANISLEREEKKIRKKNSNLVTHPSRNTAEQGLTLLSGRDAVPSLWYNDSTLDNFYSGFRGNSTAFVVIDPTSMYFALNIDRV